MRRVTLQRIAQELGLSTYAVSRSLSGKKGVSEATRQRVVAAAGHLGYTRPAAAPGRDIGLVFYDLDHANGELRMQIQSGVQREAHRLQNPVRLLWAHTPEQVAGLARSCTGLLLVGPHERETIARVSRMRVPVVRLGWVDPLESVDQVIGTDHEAGRAVARYLVGLGHRRIVYVHGAPGLRGRRERLYGAREVLEEELGLALPSIEFDDSSGFVGALRRLRRGGALPTAFFCAHDGLALTVVSELLALGYRIPDDISVVGFGDFSAAMQITPQLTTVRIEGEEIGAAGLRLLLDRIRTGWQQETPAYRVLVASRIMERRSTGPARPPDTSRAPARRPDRLNRSETPARQTAIPMPTTGMAPRSY